MSLLSLNFFTAQLFFNMDFYSAQVLFFVTINAGLSYRQYKQPDGRSKTSKEMAGGNSAESIAAAKAVNWHFKIKFLPVYLLVFGADWLQVCDNDLKYHELLTDGN